MRIVQNIRDGEIPRRACNGIGFNQRLEQPSDDAFLFALFCQSRGPGENFAFLEPALREQLMRQQFIGQSAGYRAQYPNARFEILEQDQQTIGRVVVDETFEAMTIVDLALLPEWRGRGIGSYAINTILAEAREARKPVFLCVFASNTDALRLYRRLGFEICSASEIDICMEWRPRSA
jgi:ribosomal protein S18 acetylase RimI-like enzyme